MNLYWYIYYKVYEDDRLIGYGRLPQAYTYKNNAERRARQLWGKPCYNPLTKSTIKHKWIISQTDPWESLCLEGDIYGNFR